MRKTITIILLAGIVALFIACSQKNQTYTEVDLLVDVTGKQLIVPTADEILPLFYLENRWNGAVFNASSISDISIDKNYEISLEPSNKWNNSQPIRDKKIKKFKSDLSGIINDLKTQTGDKNNSAVYLAISKKLGLLAKTKATTKKLIVMSDLLENTDVISFYRSSDLSLLKTKPDAIREKFEKLSPLPDLTGVEIHFVFEPENMKDDEVYQEIIGVYKTMIENKGGTVNITANL